MKIECAWCGKDMGEKEPLVEPGPTHGICDDCLLHNFPHLYDKIKAIISR